MSAAAAELKLLDLAAAGDHSCRDILFSAAAAEEEDERVYDFYVDRACVGKYGGLLPKPMLFPPPIPTLVTSAERRCYTPWRLERTYTDDGRLVVEKVPAKCQQYYFRSSRQNGRRWLHRMDVVMVQPSMPYVVALPKSASPSPTTMSNSSCKDKEEGSS